MVELPRRHVEQRGRLLRLTEHPGVTDDARNLHADGSLQVHDEPLADGLLAREERLGHAAADDDYGRRAGTVGAVVEGPPSENGNPEGAEVVSLHPSDLSEPSLGG